MACKKVIGPMWYTYLKQNSKEITLKMREHMLLNRVTTTFCYSCIDRGGFKDTHTSTLELQLSPKVY